MARRLLGRSAARGLRACLAGVLILPVVVMAEVATAPPASALGLVRYVNQLGTDGGGTNDCLASAPVAACATVSHALTQLEPGDTIHVNGTIFDNVVINTPVTIVGGTQAVIDGGDLGSVVIVNQPTTLDNLTIQNGNDERGGGIYAEHDLTVTNSVITGNVATSEGGGIFAGHELIITDTLITGNQADVAGGGVDIATDVTSNLTMTRSTVSNNTSNGDGGGLTLNAPATIVDSTVANNVGASAGGGVRSTGLRSDLVIRRSTFDGNSTGGLGGGVLASRGLTIDTSTFHQNIAGDGDDPGFGASVAVIGGDADAAIVSSTIATSTAASYSSLYSGNQATLRLAGSVLLGDLDGDGDGPVTPNCSKDPNAHIVSDGYNVANDVSCFVPATAPDVWDILPQYMVGPLLDHGGPTKTMAPEPGSPIIDHIENPHVIELNRGTFRLCGRVDQRNLSSRTTELCDAGAHEHEPVGAGTTQTITWGSVPDQWVRPTPLDLTPFASSDSELPLTFVVPVAGVCTVSGSMLTFIGIGTCSVHAFQPGNGSYLPAAPAIVAIPVLAGQPQPDLTVTSLLGVAGTPLALEADGGDGTGALTFDLVDNGTANCSISGPGSDQLNATQEGTCSVTATKAASAGWLSKTSDAATITIEPAVAVPEITSNDQTTFTIGDSGTFTVTASGGPKPVISMVGPLPDGVTFDASAPGTATLAGTPAAGEAGDYLLTFKATNDQGEDEEAFTLHVDRRAQDPLAITPTTGSVLDPLALGTTGGSGGGLVTFEMVTGGDAQDCELSESPVELTASAAGTCRVRATKAGDDTFDPKTVETDITLTKGAQAVVVMSPASGYVGIPLTLAATGGSGTGGYTFEITDSGVTGCTISGTPPYVLNATAPGTCTVQAIRSGGGLYENERSTPVAVTILARPAVPEFTSAASTTFTVSLPGTFNVVTTEPTALTIDGALPSGVTFAQPTPGGAGVLAGTPAAGTAGEYDVAITATNPLGEETTQLFKLRVVLRAQAALTAGPTTGFARTLLPLTHSGGSGTGEVTFGTTEGSAGCGLIVEDIWQLIASRAGTCEIIAHKAGDDTYEDVTSELTLVTFAKAAQTPLQITSTSGTLAGPLTLTTSGGSGGGLVTYQVVNGTATGCTVSSGQPFTLTATTQGTCSVTATKAGNEAYEDGQPVTAAVTITKAPQTITFTSTAPTNARPGGPAYLVTATGGASGKPVTFTLADTSTGCALSGNRVTFTAVGTCRINANQAGNPTYKPAPQARQAFAVKLPPPTVSTSTWFTVGAVGVYGQEHKLVFQAKVTASNKLRPPGKVLIRTGSTTLCTITLVNGAGTCSPSPTALPVGTYSVTATYQRSGAYAASTSTPKTLFIVPPG